MLRRSITRPFQLRFSIPLYICFVQSWVTFPLNQFRVSYLRSEIPFFNLDQRFHVILRPIWTLFRPVLRNPLPVPRPLPPSPASQLSNTATRPSQLSSAIPPVNSAVHVNNQGTYFCCSILLFPWSWRMAGVWILVLCTQTLALIWFIFLEHHLGQDPVGADTAAHLPSVRSFLWLLFGFAGWGSISVGSDTSVPLAIFWHFILGSALVGADTASHLASVWIVCWLIF